MKRILFVVFFLTGPIQSFAQFSKHDVIATSGEFFSNSSHSISWTLGECTTETFTATENTLTQGFQQSVYLITSIDDLTIEGITVKAYPNPVSDLINISVKTEDGIQKQVLVRLYDSQGKNLLSDKFSTDLIQLDMSQYSGGFYLLKLANQDNQIIQNFKIQKIN